MISALPFSGGAYGLARLLIGFYPGFMVGIFEAIEYIFPSFLRPVSSIEMRRPSGTLV
eukprot:gene17292-22828_t